MSAGVFADLDVVLLVINFSGERAGAVRIQGQSGAVAAVGIRGIEQLVGIGYPPQGQAAVSVAVSETSAEVFGEIVFGLDGVVPGFLPEEAGVGRAAHIAGSAVAVLRARGRDSPGTLWDQTGRWDLLGGFTR